MGIERAMVAFFSGTGCTERVAKSFSAALSSCGVETDLQEIKKGSALPNGKEDLLLVVFAVHAANAPEPVYEWLDQMQGVQGNRAAVIAVSGGGEVTPNKGCRLGCIRRLTRKGYNVVYEDSAVMPSNVLVSTPEDVSLRLLQVLPQKVKKVTEDILSGKVKRVKPGPLNRFLAFAMKAEQKGVKGFAKSYFVDGNCNGCGWCSRKCPAENIRMEGDRPVFGRECLMCLKCYYGCPKRAIQAKAYKFALLKDGLDIGALERKAAESGEAQIKEMPKSILFKGIRKYLEGI
jgi:ferredoxin